MNELIIKSKLDTLYMDTLFSIKSICIEMGIWSTYTKEEQYKLENITKRDSVINKHFRYKGSYEDKYIYGEVLCNGVDQIINKINRYFGNNYIFIDIGSGLGKIVIHNAILAKGTFIGVDIVKERVMYAKYLKNKIIPENDNVFFINKDIKDFDLSIANVVFLNSVSFDNKEVIEIYNKIPTGCHIITNHILDCKLMKEEFDVDVSWGGKITLRYYIK